MKIKASDEPPMRNPPLNLLRPNTVTVSRRRRCRARAQGACGAPYKSQQSQHAPSKQPSSSRYYFSMLPYQEAVKKMIIPESSRHAVTVYSSRFKIIACFPPPIFCLSTAIISAILAAHYSEDGSHCLLLLYSPQTGFLNCVISQQQNFKKGSCRCVCVWLGGGGVEVLPIADAHDRVRLLMHLVSMH